MQRGDREEYKSLTVTRRGALRHDKQLWADRLAVEGEERLSQGHSGSFLQISVSCERLVLGSRLRFSTPVATFSLTRLPFLKDGRNTSRCFSIAQFHLLQLASRPLQLRLMWTSLSQLPLQLYGKSTRQSRKSSPESRQVSVGYK